MSPHKQEDEDYEEDQHGPFPEKILSKILNESLQSGVLIQVNWVTDKMLQTGVLQSPVWSLQMRWKATDTPPSH